MQKELLKTKEGLYMQGPLLITPQIHFDERGFFYESWNKEKFDSLLKRKVDFVQDNHSSSGYATLRGLHFQVAPNIQEKLVRSTYGRIFDVAVDLRKDSKSFGKWIGAELSSKNQKQLWIPGGFAHGFLALTDDAEVQYKCSGKWVKSSERTIIWNDEDISIKWPLNNIVQSNIKISDKDKNGLTLKEYLKMDDVLL